MKPQLMRDLVAAVVFVIPTASAFLGVPTPLAFVGGIACGWLAFRIHAGNPEPR